MAYYNFWPALQPPIDVNADRIPGAKLKAYLTGTLTQTPTYTDSTGGTPNTWPVVADVNGKFGPVFISTEITYRIRLTDASDNLLWEADPIAPAIPDAYATDAEFEDFTDEITAATVYVVPGDTEMKAIDAPAADRTVFNAARDQIYRFDDADYSDYLNSEFFIAGDDDPTGATGAWKQAFEDRYFYTPEMFGAAGDGIENDTLALQRMASQINSDGGGTIMFKRNATYMIGIQAEGAGDYYLDPEVVMEFSGLSGPLIIHGNGATIKCVDGLKYGTFDNVTGDPIVGMGSLDEIATPYRWMIRVQSCSGLVHIENLVLDGNIENAVIGGGYDGVGTQIPMTGFGLYDNTGGERVVNVETHHHGLDGYILDGPSGDESALQAKGEMVQVNSHHNGRQGCSWVGGKNYTFNACRFNYTGIDIGDLEFSLPGAGIDLEAEGGKLVRKGTFNDCEFIGNKGIGMVADQGDVADVYANRCTFIGATNYALWFNKPKARFNQCFFVGSSINLYPNADPDIATQFTHCTFSDDPDLSPTGTVYTQDPSSSRSILDAGGTGGTNILLHRCVVDLVDVGALPYGDGFIIQDCTFTQTTAAKDSFTGGTYRGKVVVTTAGTWSPGAPVYEGQVIVNGEDYTRGSQAIDLPNITSLGTYTTDVTLKGVVKGDTVLVKAPDIFGSLIIQGVGTAPATFRLSVHNMTPDPHNEASATFYYRLVRSAS